MYSKGWNDVDLDIKKNVGKLRNIYFNSSVDREVASAMEKKDDNLGGNIQGPHPYCEVLSLPKACTNAPHSYLICSTHFSE